MNTRLSLREAYNLHKEKYSVQEAAALLESHFLLVEKIDTATISRIVDSMSGIEQALGPLLGKLPSLRMALDSAEAELMDLVSGKGGNDQKKTGKMLGKALSFYQNLSSFLRQDLPVLLRTGTLSAAKANPDQPVGLRIQPAFLQALKLDKTGSWLAKLFSSDNIPYVNNETLATELTGLSYNELMSLTKVSQVQGVITQTQLQQVATQLASPAATTPATPGGAADSAAVDIKAVMDKLGGPQGMINFLQKNQLDKSTPSAVAKALASVLAS